jgi:hypothetical protein
MELASMLAGESFSDRPSIVSPVIAAFLRTYNDGVDDDRRQDLYPLASLIVGSAGSRAVERERMSRCLEFARTPGDEAPGERAAIGIASAEASGSWAAVAALRDGPSDETRARALAFAVIWLRSNRPLAAGGGRAGHPRTIRPTSRRRRLGSSSRPLLRRSVRSG